jgi:hypothetical protein
MLRVNKQRPCIGCGKADWCLISEDGTTSLCMRVQSTTQKTMKDGSVGWIHRLGNAAPARVLTKKETAKHLSSDALEQIMADAERTDGADLPKLADDLGVRMSSLMELRTVWLRQYNAFGFPMYDGLGNIIGIRLRDWIGRKWAVPGSQNGIFMTTEAAHGMATDELFVVEGLTDVAAMGTMNLRAIGRPSCTGCLAHVKAAAARMRARRVYVISDNDSPGISGAESLVRNITLPCCLMTLPVKDVRQFVQAGGDRQMLEDLLSSAVWSNCRTRGAI